MGFISLGQIGLLYDIVGAIVVAASFLLTTNEKIVKANDSTTLAIPLDVDGMIKARNDACAGVASLATGFTLQLISPWTIRLEPFVLVPIEVVALFWGPIIAGIYFFIRPALCEAHAKAVRQKAQRDVVINGGTF